MGKEYHLIQNIMLNKKWIFIIFVLFACFFHLDKVFLEQYALVRIHDSFNSEFSRYRALGELFLKHGFFAWYPNVFCGMPSYAFHFAPYYVLCLLSTFIPLWLLYTVLVISLMTIAGFGMYWFLKDFLNINPILSFASGIFFSLYTQVKPHPIVHLVFNYAFPIFFMCLIWSKPLTFKTKLLSFLIILSIMLVSYPLPTIPMFFVLQVLVILLLDFQKKESKGEMVIKTVFLWMGYIFLCLPVFYELYKFTPFAQREYGLPVNLIPFLSFLKKHFVMNLIDILRDSSVFLFVVGFLPLLYYSNKMRKAFFVFLVPLFLASFFTGPSLNLLSQTIFEKMDMGHFFFTLHFAITIFVVLGFQELFSKRAPKLLYYISFLIAVILYIAVEKKRIISPVNLNLTVPLLIVIIIYFFKKSIDKENSGIFSRTKIPLLVIAISLFLIVIIQFKVLRITDEYIPYKRFFDNNSVFITLKKEEGDVPFRVGTLSDVPMMAQTYGIETVDGRSPIQPKYYKEYFKEIIRPQLTTESNHAIFDNYWYQLYLHDPEFFRPDGDGKFGGIRLVMPLLLMINTKYIVSENYNSYLDSISEKIIKSECDNIAHPDSICRFLQKFDLNVKLPLFKIINEKGLKKTSRGSIFESVYGTPLFIYKLKNSFERGYLAKSIVVLPSDSEVLSTLAKQPIEALKGKVFFSAQDSINLEDFPTIQKSFNNDNDSEAEAFFSAQGSINLEDFPTIQKSFNNNNEVKIVYYSPDRIIFDGVISSPSILVVTNSYHPNWNVTVNGKKTKIYRANHAFQAVFIENIGRVNVVFEYNDKLLWKTHFAVPFGVILIIISIFCNLKKQNRTIGRRVV